MAYTLSRNLKLRIDSNLTANSKYNLERLDLLGSTFLVDSTNQLNVRSSSNILIEPESADIGGSGVGGTVSIGTASHDIDTLLVYATNFNLSTNLGLADQAIGGTRNLLVRYKSDLNSAVDTAADRVLSVDLDGANRSLVLGGSLSQLGGDLTLNLSGTTSINIPQTGTLSTLSGVEILTNKTISAISNTISGISNSSISASAAISYSKLALTNSIVDSDVSSSAAISYSKLNLANFITNSDISPSASIVYSKLSIVNSVVNADINSAAAISYSKLNLSGSVTNLDIAAGAAIARSKVAAGTASHVVVNDGSGLLSSVAILSTSIGGTGVSGTAVFPTSGTVLTATNTSTLSNKTIDGGSNSLTNIAYSSLVLTNSVTNTDISATAGISYTKLNLTGSILNADVAVGAAIAGTKINPVFGNQVISTLDRLQFEEGGLTTALRAAQSGQSANLDFRLPPSHGTDGQVLKTNGSGEMDWITVGGTGTVTSVALAAPAEFAVSGSPVTTAGTLTLDWENVPANAVLSGPTTGADATPSFRLLVSNDIPTGLTATKIADGSVDNTEFQYLNGATSNIQGQLNGKQPLDATLTSLAAYNTNGFLVQTGSDVFAGRTLIAGTGISIANGDGVASNPTISSTITQYTDELAQDAVGTIFLDTASVNLTYNDGTPSISADVIPGGVDHDQLLNFVANEHVDHTAVQIATAANSGLTGGGTIATTRNIVVDPTNAPSITPATGDTILLADASNSNLLSKTTVGDIVALASVNSYKEFWSNADGTTKVITHNLGTVDVIVQIFDSSVSGDTLYVNTVVRTDINTVTLTSTQAPTVAWRVLILAV